MRFKSLKGLKVQRSRQTFQLFNLSTCIVLILAVGACAIEPTSDLSSMPDDSSIQELPPSQEPPPSSEPVQESPPPTEEPPVQDSPPPSQEPPPTTTATAWQLTLKVSVPDAGADGGVAYNRLVAGERETATDAFDNASDIRAFLAGPVQASFVHTGDTGYDQNSEQLWQDLRAVNLPEEWEIEVMAESGRTVTLSWTLPTEEVRCGTHQFTLVDSDGQLGQTNLCTTESLTYLGDGQLRHFVLRIS